MDNKIFDDNELKRLSLMDDPSNVNDFDDLFDEIKKIDQNTFKDCGGYPEEEEKHRLLFSSILKKLVNEHDLNKVKNEIIVYKKNRKKLKDE